MRLFIKFENEKNLYNDEIEDNPPIGFYKFYTVDATVYVNKDGMITKRSINRNNYNEYFL